MVGVVAFGLVYVLNHAEGLGAAHTTITYPWPDHRGLVGWGHISQGKPRFRGAGQLPENPRRVGCSPWVGNLSTGTCSMSSPTAVGLNGPAWLSCVWLASSSSLSSALPVSTWCWSLGGALPMNRCRPWVGPRSDEDEVSSVLRGPGLPRALCMCRRGGGGVRAGLQGPSAKVACTAAVGEALVLDTPVGLGVWGCATTATSDSGPRYSTAPCRNRLGCPGWEYPWADLT